MSKDVAMIAISTDNTSAFMVNDGKLLLLTPPYLASDQIEVTENDIDKALQLDQFKECDHKFDNMKEAISFLENQYIEMLKGFGVVKPSTENLKELLKYADEDVYMNYLKRTKYELIPNKKFDIAETIVIDIMDLNRENPDIENMAIDILQEIQKLREDKKRIIPMRVRRRRMKEKARYSNLVLAHTFGKFSSKRMFKLTEKVPVKKDMPHFTVGDRIRVSIKIVKAGKERIQTFEGTVIARKHNGLLSETFTIQLFAYGNIAKKTFLLNSPAIDSIAVLTRDEIRRAKLYGLRGKSI